MSDEIKPSLTPEEWKKGRDGRWAQWYVDESAGVVDVMCDDYRDWHALAAIALNQAGDFGFTHSDATKLLAIAETIEHDNAAPLTAERVRRIARKIAALLRTEEATP